MKFTSSRLGRTNVAFMVAGLAAAIVATPMAAQADRLTPPSSGFDGNPPGGAITIDVVTANGTGCRPGTAAVAMSPDNTAMTMTFSEYVAEVGSGIAPANFRKNCQLALDLHVPQGFSYGVVQADYRGFAEIAQGATGQQRASYYYQGDSTTMRAWTPLKGKYSGDYTFTDKKEVANVVWSPCGERRLLNINTELRIQKGSSGNAYSMMTTDSADVSVKTKFHFAWKKC